MENIVTTHHIGIGCHIRECSQVRTLPVELPVGVTPDPDDTLRPAAYRAVASGGAEFLLFDDGAAWTIHADGHARCPDHKDAENYWGPIRPVN